MFVGRKNKTKEMDAWRYMTSIIKCNFGEIDIKMFSIGKMLFLLAGYLQTVFPLLLSLLTRELW